VKKVGEDQFSNLGREQKSRNCAVTRLQYDERIWHADVGQVALLWQRDRATRLSVEILQLQNIPFEN